MTHFKEGGVYVDDATAAVYVCYQTTKQTASLYEFTSYDKDSRDWTSIFLNHFDNGEKYLQYFKRNSFVRDGDYIDLRPWQPSDEPDFYDEKRWWEVKIGAVYKGAGEQFLYPAYKLGEMLISVVYTKNEGIIYNRCRSTMFIRLITRLAFPDEVAGLKLPQIEGEI